MDFSKFADFINFIEAQDFEEVVWIVIADCLNVNSGEFSYKQIAKKLRIKQSDAKDVINALVCLIMYLAKIKCKPKELEAIYPQMGLKTELKPAFLNTILPALSELREVMETTEDDNYCKFKDIEWRLSVSIGSRLKKEMVEPKFTMKLTMEDENSKLQNFLIDSDYSNMVKLRDELTEALQSLDSPFSKKVFKFVK